MQNSIRVNVLQDLSIIFDAEVDCVYEISIFDGHDLVIEIHKDDVFSVVLNAEFSFCIIHYIIDAIEGSRFDVF